MRNHPLTYDKIKYVVQVTEKFTISTFQDNTFYNCKNIGKNKNTTVEVHISSKCTWEVHKKSSTFISINSISFYSLDGTMFSAFTKISFDSLKSIMKRIPNKGKL